MIVLVIARVCVINIAGNRRVAVMFLSSCAFVPEWCC